jgi:hypothetical protein
MYVRTDSGWLGLFPHGTEYARFPLNGPAVQLQNANSVLVTPNLGLSIEFADKKDLDGPDLLSAHARWEANYWREHADSLATELRADLAGSRQDVRVTQFTVLSGGGTLVIYLVGLRSADRVFAFGFSPAGAGADSVVTQFVRQLELVHRPLDPAEVKRIIQSLKK